MRGHSPWDHRRTAGEHRGAEEPPCAQWSEEVPPGGDESWDVQDVCTGSVLLPSRRAGNFTLHVFPSRAAAGKKETGSTEPSGNQGGWAGISQPFPARSGPLILASHRTWGSSRDSFLRTSWSCRPLQRGKLGLEWCGDEGGEQGYDRSCLWGV